MKSFNMPAWQRYIWVVLMGFILSVMPINTAIAEKVKVTNSRVVSKIAVVNMDIIMQKSIVAKNIRAQIDKKRVQYQNKIKKHEKELLSFQKAVVKEQKNLKEDKLKEKKKIFKEKILKAQKDAQVEMRQIDIAVEKALKQLRTKAAKIVGDIAKKRGFDIVLSHQQVILAARSLDITDEVLTRLDKEMKSINVKWK